MKLPSGNIVLAAETDLSQIRPPYIKDLINCPDLDESNDDAARPEMPGREINMLELNAARSSKRGGKAAKEAWCHERKFQQEWRRGLWQLL